MITLKYFFIASLLSFVFLFSAGAAKADPPAGFQTIPLITNGLTAPTGLGIAPDGRIFILEQSGQIKIYKNGTLLSKIFDEVPASNSGEKGLLGVAFDPDYTTNHYAYFHYVDTNNFHRIVRYDVSTDVATAPPVNIYQTTIPTQALIHKAGTVQFGQDGKLYLSIGDDGYGLNAQDLSKPFGKILRLNKDGSVPSDNPFVGDNTKLPEIWAYGFRNPFRFQFDPQTGDLLEGEVGEATWEEVNRVVKGANYGWPTCEGSCNIAGMTNPIYQYNHNGAGASITGGLVYRGTMFPAQYQGSYFFGDYVKGTIRRLTFDGSGNVNGDFDFDMSAHSSVDFKQASDGSIYYVSIVPPALYRIVFNNGNKYPTANASADVTTGPDPLTVHFSSSGSSDPENAPLNFTWNFGDGTTSTDPNPVKTYNNKGRYIVQVTVSDGVNSVQSSPIIVQSGIPPVVTISAPQNGQNYRAGDTINYAATAKAYDNTDIPDSNFTTEVIFHHNTHTHPFVRPITSRTGQFIIPNTGESSADTWYEIDISAKDANGLITTKSINIYPLKSHVTLNSFPAGLKLSLNGTLVDPQTFESVVGFRHEIDAPSQQLNGKNYEFDHWSDGLSRRHFITATDNDSSYTAYFRETPPFTGEYFNNITLSGNPTLIRTDPVVDFNWGAGSPDPQINVDMFSARWTKKQFFNYGRYQFTTSSDDGVRLYVDGKLLIDKWQDQGLTSYSSTVDLVSGEHDIRLEYYDRGGGAAAKLTWDLTPDQPPSQDWTGYKVDYFNNTALTGTPALSTTESTINHSWGNGSPSPAVQNDQFSARWTKVDTLATGYYRFIVTADDGVRLFLDGKLIVDKWINEPPTRYTIDKMINSGVHTITMEYYENFGSATAKLSYQKIADTQTAGFNGEYYPNKSLTGVPYITRYDTDINNDWGNASPGSGIPNDLFSVRWTKTNHFDSGTYRINLVADDGVRVYIDGSLVLDKWIDQPPTFYSFDNNLYLGDHTVVVEYYEAYGGATMKFSMTKL